jgi:HlyD family secretion protein
VKPKLLLIVGGLLVLAVVVVASIKAGGGGEKVKVYAEKAVRRDITQTVKASGQITPRVKVNISSHLIGKIDRMYVHEGEDVKEGQPFLQLEQQAFIAARDDARARLAMAETQLKQSEVDLSDQNIKLARARELFGQGISSKEALETAQLQHESADLKVRSAHEAVTQAKALLDKAEDDLRKTTIWAPLAGRVIALNAKEGEVVVSGTMNNPASVIGTIADLSEILAEVDVDETEVVDVKPGLDATVEVDAIPDFSYQGKVVEVGSSGYSKPAQPDVQFFRVKVLLEHPDDRLRAGMSARAEIHVATHQNALVIPIQAVVDRKPLEGAKKEKSEAGTADTGAGMADEEVPVVFVVEGGDAHQRSVKTGISDTTHVEIVDGLSDGQQVVTGPYRSIKKLKDGDRVEVTEEKKGEEGGEEER